MAKLRGAKSFETPSGKTILCVDWTNDHWDCVELEDTGPASVAKALAKMVEIITEHHKEGRI